MNDTESGIFWIGFVLGAAVALLAVTLALFLVPQDDFGYDEENGDECVIITQSETLIIHPEYGEDDGAIYCPTGAVSVSMLGRVVEGE